MIAKYSSIEALETKWQDLIKSYFKKKDTKTIKQICKEADTQAKAILIVALLEVTKQRPKDWYMESGFWNTLLNLVRELLKKKHTLSQEQAVCLVECLIKSDLDNFSFPVNGVIKSLLAFAKEGELPKESVENLQKIHSQLEGEYDANLRRAASMISDMIHKDQKEIHFPLETGEIWGDFVLKQLEGFEDDKKVVWSQLLQHAQSSAKAKPSKKWLTAAAPLLKAVEESSYVKIFENWLKKLGSDKIGHKNSDILRGLIQYGHLFKGEQIATLMGDAAESCLKKGKGGSICARAGKAAVEVLDHLDGRAIAIQLFRLKSKIKAEWIRDDIAKAFARAAKREGFDESGLEESAPDFGLTDIGILRQEIGNFQVELVITSAKNCEISWIKADGKKQKSVPAQIKRDYAENLEKIKKTKKEILRMLSVQRNRLESLYLNPKTWKMSVWQRDYMGHPLMATLARRLIWNFHHKNKKIAGIWWDDDFLDINGKAIKLNKNMEVSLWHPLQENAQIVLDWRNWLQHREIIQPFKQAHREIYIITDAELATKNYSHRFASHIVRQHQLRALAEERRWLTGGYIGNWDSGECFPTQTLTHWKIKAEFWVDASGINEFSEAGVQVYIATDQIRFYKSGKILELKKVPALVFSEIMRDIDLFIGVCSIGNDPQWRLRDETNTHSYWENYAFGELCDSANNRREILKNLIPKLKIAKRCEITPRFLIVRGDLRSYKIHFRSGNILMEPNDQYLCIVQSGAGSNVYLPFEGDQMLSVILSKAVLLANDAKIKDKTILNQIKIK